MDPQETLAEITRLETAVQMKPAYVVILLAIIAILVSACGPSEAQIAKAIAETEAARPTETQIPPTPTPTRVPMTELDISDLLIQEGDLPAGYSTGQIRREPVKRDDSPEPALYTQVELVYQGEAKGIITVRIYKDPETARECYEGNLPEANEYYDIEAVEGIGEEAVVMSSFVPLITGQKLQAASVDFIRCTMAVEIFTSASPDTTPWEYYAKNLDQRLADVVCPYMD